MDYTILILLLPFFSFLLLGVFGKWFSHKAAGLVGTVVLGVVAAMAYYTAFQYFFRDTAYGRRCVAHTHALQLSVAALLCKGTQLRYGYHARPHLGYDADRHHDRIAHGTHLLFWLYARRTRFPALLCLP